MELYLGVFDVEGAKNKAKLYINMPDMKEIFTLFDKTEPVVITISDIYKKLKGRSKPVKIKCNAILEAIDAINIKIAECKAFIEAYYYNCNFCGILDVLTYSCCDKGLQYIIPPIEKKEDGGFKDMGNNLYREFESVKDLKSMFEKYDLNELDASRTEALSVQEYTRKIATKALKELSVLINQFYCEVVGLSLGSVFRFERNFEKQQYKVAEIHWRISLINIVKNPGRGLGRRNFEDYFPVDLQEMLEIGMVQSFKG